MCWVGYEIGLRDWTLGISEARARWLIDWMMKTVEAKAVDLADLTAVLGRLAFAMGPLDFLRPFLAPIFAWTSAAGSRGVVLLPWSMLFLFKMLAEMLAGSGRYIEVEPEATDLGEAFRADAKAEGQEVVIGAWECLGGTRPSSARWFALRLTRASAPWAFAKGEPFKVVAALELFGTLMAVKVFGDKWPKSTRGMLKIGGSTDNGGNPHVLTRLMTSKFPLVVILAEIAAEMKANNWKLGLEWIPRGQNEEADDLTNWEFGRFSAEKRVEVDLQKVSWLLLERFMKEATDLYDAVVALKKRKEGISEAEGKGGTREKKSKKLRDRDPLAVTAAAGLR